MARLKGEGSIYQKNGRYFFRIEVNGKRKAKLLKATTHKEAEIESKQYVQVSSVVKSQLGFATFKAEALGLIEKENATHLGNIFELFENNKTRPDCTSKTLAQHKKYWTEFILWLRIHHPNVKTLRDINSNIVNQYFAYIDKVLKGAGFNYRRNTLKLICKTVEPDIVNLFASIRKKRSETEIRKALDKESFWKVVEACKDDRFYLEFKNEYEVLFYIGAFTGMRLKDCCMLKWDKIDFENNVIHCIPEKTKKSSGRMVSLFLTPDLKEKLIPAQSWKKNEYVLPELTRIYERGFNTISQETKRVINWALCKDEAIKNSTSSLRKIEKQGDYSFHSLRHTFATNCIRKGVDIEKIKDSLGHSSATMTRTYAHQDPEELKKISAATPSRYETQKTPEEKLQQIRKFLESKDSLTKNEKTILDLLK